MARGRWRRSLLALALAVGHQVVAIREQRFQVSFGRW